MYNFLNFIIIKSFRFATAFQVNSRQGSVFIILQSMI